MPNSALRDAWRLATLLRDVAMIVGSDGRLPSEQSQPNARQNEWATSRWSQLVLMGLLLAGFGLRLHELIRQDIWWDEARNIDVALRPFWQVATAPELDIHPPIYFWALHGWGRLAALQIGADPTVLCLPDPLPQRERRHTWRWSALCDDACSRRQHRWLERGRHRRLFTLLARRKPGDAHVHRRLCAVAGSRDSVLEDD